MKLQKRNLVSIYYCLYDRMEPILDDYGNETGEQEIIYGEPVKLTCSVSTAAGTAQIQAFGNLDSYDKVLIIEDKDCPIDENAVLFIDKEPDYEEGKPAYDYIVKRVAPSLNFLFCAVSKVKVQ